MGLDEFLNLLPEDEEESVSYSALPKLSGLTNAEADEFGLLWLEWPSERVAEMLNRMDSLCDEQSDVEFEAIFKQGLNHPNESVRLNALKGLEDTEDRTLVRPLIKILEQDESIDIRTAAGETIAHLTVLAQSGKLGRKDPEILSTALMGVLQNPTEYDSVKLKALEAISVFGGEELDPFIEAAWDSGDIHARQSSIFAMGRTSNPKWAEKVVQDLDHDAVAVRYEAAMAIGEVGDERHLRNLDVSLEDSDLTVQLAAISAVERIGGDVAKDKLQGMLTSSEPRVVEAAQQSLQILKEEEELDEVVTPEMARGMYGSADTLPGVDLEGYEAAEIEGWSNMPDPAEVDDFGTGVTEEAEELGLDRGDPFDVDLPPQDPWDHEENF